MLLEPAERIAVLVRVIALALVCMVSFAEASVAQTLDRIVATKILRIGFIRDQAPFTSMAPNGVPAGYALDLCGKVAEEIGRSVGNLQQSYVETSLTAAFEAIASDQIDLLCGAVSITLARRELADFSEPIFLTGASALMRSDSPRDLRELFLGERMVSAPRSPELRPFAVSRIGVRTGSTTEALIRQTIASEKYQSIVLVYETHSQGLAALESGLIDAYFADRALLAELMTSARHSSRLMIGTRLLTRESYGIAMKRGDPAFRLLVDRVLTRFYATPDFSGLLARYFGEEAPAIQSQILFQSIPE